MASPPAHDYGLGSGDKHLDIRKQKNLSGVKLIPSHGYFDVVSSHMIDLGGRLSKGDPVEQALTEVLLAGLTSSVRR